MDEISALSARAPADELNRRMVATPKDGRWHASSVILVRERLAAPEHKPNSATLRRFDTSSPARPQRRGPLPKFLTPAPAGVFLSTARISLARLLSISLSYAVIVVLADHTRRPLRADTSKRPPWQGRFFIAAVVAGRLLDCWPLPPVLNRAALQRPPPVPNAGQWLPSPRRGPHSLPPDSECPPDQRGDEDRD
jgi:hypothetical protein